MGITFKYVYRYGIRAICNTTKKKKASVYGIYYCYVVATRHFEGLESFLNGTFNSDKIKVKLGLCQRELLYSCSRVVSVLTEVESCRNACCKAGSCSYCIYLVEVSIIEQ